jgi:signal transduction histidine kinase
MFRSTIFKLTTYYIILASLLCIIFSGILFDISKDELDQGLENQEKSINHNYDVDQSYSLNTQKLIDQRVNSDKIRVLYVDAVVILVSIGASYILARRTIRPVRDAYNEQLRFVADASHELRTPLAEMRLGTEVALRDKNTKNNNKKLIEVLNQNLNDVDGLENLTNRLLDISRYKSGLTKNNMDNISLERVLNSAVKNFSEYSKKHSVKIKTS